MLAFAELVAFIEDEGKESATKVFKRCEKVSLYKERLVQLRAQIDRVHSTRLKNILLANFPDLIDSSSAKKVFLAFVDEDV